ncbi:MAG: 7-cyano-7-deazaguanine synthase QueC [Deltaproteobacteria bacterium]|nr:7-cyano-7-deazaguanine synthase QueC [Deltaproteobacteria bacterium]
MSRAVVLLSGGLDSATALAVARADGHECHALTFRYGQRHAVELAAAAAVARSLGVAEHRVVDVDLRWIGGSALTAPIPVPKHRPRDEPSPPDDIPITYVPGRNTIFLAFAVAWAEVLGATDVYLGINAVDYSGYPDCRPEFLEAFARVARLGTRAGALGGDLRVRAPLAGLDKAAIIRLGLSLGVDYGLTHSCYDPDAAGRACGACDSCQLRRRGFAQAGVPDPTAYAE